MKQFKHITGEIVYEQLPPHCHLYKYHSNKFGFISPDLVEQSSEFEEITQVDYEILSFININTNNFVKLQKNGKYSCEQSESYILNKGIYTLKECLEFEYLSIYSIKRISDNEIFTIDDKTDYGTIELFELIVNNIFVNTVIIHKSTTNKSHFAKHKKLLNNIVKSKQPLFTTVDNVEIFEGDKYYSVDTNMMFVSNFIHTAGTGENRTQAFINNSI